MQLKSNKKQELKPCPFCGGEAELVENKSHKMVHICCQEELCSLFTGTAWYETKEEAVETWNTRVSAGMDDSFYEI